MKSLLMKWTLFRRKWRNVLLKAKYIKSGKINRASVSAIAIYYLYYCVILQMHFIPTLFYLFIMFRIMFS